MANADLVTKRVAIDKTNTQMVIVVSVAAFVTVFCLVAAHTIWSQNSYQARVTSAKEKAKQQLLTNISAYDNLNTSYQSFISTPNNVIGGLSSSTGDNDGDNSKVILDALPDSYDFPALTSSIEKLLTDRHFTISAITGTDDQVNQQSNISSPTPQSVVIPFTFTVTGANYGTVGKLLTALQQSIRPISIDSMTLSGGSNNMSVTVNAHTYYQPSKNVSITKQVVK